LNGGTEFKACITDAGLDTLVQLQGVESEIAQMVFRHKIRTRKYALKACKLAREAVKLALIRRDTRRTSQFRFPSIQKEAGNSRQQSCDIVPDSLGSVIRFINVRSSEGLTTSKNHFLFYTSTWRT
jgi:hypothetical protein